MTEALRLVGVERHYKQGDARLDILRGVDFTLRSGEAVALTAPSGAGKSTLLHVAGLLERPDGGDVLVEGASTIGMSDDGRTALRRSDSASSTSSTTCCRNSRRAKTSCCRR